MKLLLIAACVIIAGCAAPQYSYVGTANQSAAQQAYAECDYEAGKVADTIRNGIEAGMVRANMRRKCMALKGYAEK